MDTMGIFELPDFCHTLVTVGHYMCFECGAEMGETKVHAITTGKYSDYVDGVRRRAIIVENPPCGCPPQKEMFISDEETASPRQRSEERVRIFDRHPDWFIQDDLGELTKGLT